MGSNPTATANGLLAVAVSNPGFTGDHVGSGGEPGQFDRDMLERDLAVAWMDPMTHPLVLRDKRAPASLIGWAEVLKDHPRDHLPRIGLMEVHAGPAAKWLRLGPAAASAIGRPYEVSGAGRVPVSGAEVILRYANFSVPMLKPVTEQDARPAPVGLSVQAASKSRAQLAEDDGEPPTSWRVTDEQKAAALDAFVGGESVSAAARAAGMAASTAHLLLKPEVEASGRQLVTWNQMTESGVEEAAVLRGQGWSYASLGARYGVTRQAVTRRLKTRQGPGS